MDPNQMVPDWAQEAPTTAIVPDWAQEQPKAESQGISSVGDIIDPKKNALYGLAVKYSGSDPFASFRPKTLSSLITGDQDEKVPSILNPLTATLPASTRHAVGMVGRTALNTATNLASIPFNAAQELGTLGHPGALGPYTSQRASALYDKYLASPQDDPERIAQGFGEFGLGSMMPIPGLPSPGQGGIRPGDTKKALEIIQSRLQNDQRPWGMATQEVQQANEAGVPLRLTDMGRNTQRTGEVLANKPGGAQATMVRDAESTLNDTTDRVAGQVRQALSAEGDAGAFSDLLKRTRSQSGKTNYEAVKQDSTPVTDPDIWHILENPYVASLYQGARARHMVERSLSTTAGKPSPPLADIFAPKIGGKAPPPGTDLNLPTKGGDTDPMAGIEWERTGAAPDVRSLDYLQRAMDKDVTRLYTEAGKGGQTGGMAENLATLRDQLIEKLKSVSPAFKKANETYGQDSKVIEAYQRGAVGGKDNFFNFSPEQAQKYVQSMSESEKTALRMGVADSLLKGAENAGNRVNLAQRVLGGSRRSDTIKTLFDGDESKYDTFMQLMGLEKKIFPNRQQLVGGSQTFGRASAGEGFSDTAAETAGKVAVMGSQIWHKWYGAAVHGLIRLQGTTWNQGVASQAARILSSGDPQAIAVGLQRLEDMSARGVGRLGKTALGLTSGTAAVATPERDRLQQKYPEIGNPSP